MISASFSVWLYQNMIERAVRHEDETISLPVGFAALVAIVCVGDDDDLW